jgi:FMNH2-dependent dimethyl sulfone monooxygenase
LSSRTASLPERIAMYNSNALKIGVFGANCSSARTATTVPERWSASWPDCLALARLADMAGIDFLLPIGRWKGYGGETDFHGTTLETVTWACGLLAATERITVFGTVHAPLFHPLIAAKEFVTADHIGEGRFGLNIVAGWNEGEFEMFGVAQREHEERYAFAQEWIDVVRRAWDDGDEFDFDGQYFKLAGVRAKPKPFGGTRPIIMNAGSSGTGQAFALRNCDAFFTATGATRTSLDGVTRKVEEVKAEARTWGHDVEVFTVGQVICRPSQREAEDYHRHANVEHADWGAIERMLALRNITPATTTPEEYAARRQYFAAIAIGGYPFVGTPDKVADELALLSRAGLRGIGLSFVNYLADLPYFCDEVLPRLARMGLRETH